MNEREGKLGLRRFALKEDIYLVGTTVDLYILGNSKDSSNKDHMLKYKEAKVKRNQATIK